MKYADQIARELNIKSHQVSAVAQLLEDGATVPFISRYRKEATGSLDDLQVQAVRDRLQQLKELDGRKEAILKSIREQNKLTPDLERSIRNAGTMTILEDLYLPYKPKRKTRASVAKEKGLQPLAKLIFSQRPLALSTSAKEFINPQKDVNSLEDALAGARDIIAEWIAENAEIRQKIRNIFTREGVISSKVVKGKETVGIKFKDYFDWSEPISKMPSHRFLAVCRAAEEGVIRFNISTSEDHAIATIEKQFLKAHGEVGEQMKMAIKDCHKRLLGVSIASEIKTESKKRADDEAIRVFAKNLSQLLMAPALGQKKVLAIDPGFRTGCKVVCLDKQGKLLDFQAIYPNEPQKDVYGAGETIKHFVNKYGIEAIAIGNGTASRETETFVKKLGLPKDVIISMVNENGASIYSASEVARDEFPDKDVTVRGSVSIGRRLMDPLAELVKIDPKSIGVGQYQHDVDQSQLKRSLDDVVMSCVNKVGVELNTASKQLLTYVSGLGPQIAQNIVDYRNENGPFKSRAALKKVPRLGAKAFEQAAGFLRIHQASNPLDHSGVHPERYDLVKTMAKNSGSSIEELIGSERLKDRINAQEYVSEEVGLPTLMDILEELEKPGRDPREQFEQVAFQEGVNEIDDLKIGMMLPGVITNITKFGAFVDVGVHQDGLVHISHLSDSFVSDPTQVVKLGQKVNVKVLEVDIPRKRISLSMKSDRPAPAKSSTPKKRLDPKPTFSPPNKKPTPQPKESKAPEGDLQEQLMKLKGKWK